MKIKFVIFSAMLYVFFLATGCSEGKKEIELKLKTSDVKGDLADYFSVIEGNYKLIKDNGKNSYLLKVQIKRTDTKYGFDAVDLESRGYFSLLCDLYDEQGVPVITADREGYRTQGKNSEDKALASLKPNETGWAIFSFHGVNNEINKIRQLQVTSQADLSTAQKGIPENKSSIPTSTKEIASPDQELSSSSVDCDKFIEDYTNFVNSYIKLYKKIKANPTDMTIMQEFTDAAQKASEMQTEAENCTDPEYATKLLELSNRIAKAIL